jgi:hypothetical protein
MQAYVLRTHCTGILRPKKELKLYCLSQLNNVFIAGASNSFCVRGVAGSAPDGQCAVPWEPGGGESSRHAQRSSQSTRHLQRSLLPQDLQLREHEEGGEDRRGRAAQHKALTRRDAARGSDAARLSTRL